MTRRRRHQSGLTRREALSMLAGSVGLAAASGCGENVPSEPEGGAPVEEQVPTDISFPDGAIVRTILRDHAPMALAGGATLFHEHLDLSQSYASPPSERGEARPLSDERVETFVALVVEELKMAAVDGMSCIVDAAIRRRSDHELEILRQMANRSGIPIVVAGGYFKAPYPDDVAAMSLEEWTEHMIVDARAQRWGVFGEVGTSMEMHDDERRFLRVVSRAHHATNLPIFTHTEHQGCPTCGLEQLAVFDEENVDPARVCVGHQSDITPEQDPGWSTHLEILSRGAYLGFDTVGRALARAGHPDIPESEKVKMVLNVLDAGYEDQLLLSADFASSVDLKSNWGSGFATTLVQFVPKLRYAGVDDATLHKITVDNPRRFLAFVP